MDNKIFENNTDIENEDENIIINDEELKRVYNDEIMDEDGYEDYSDEEYE